MITLKFLKKIDIKKIKFGDIEILQVDLTTH